jgi:hypothetical protein
MNAPIGLDRITLWQFLKEGIVAWFKSLRA